MCMPFYHNYTAKDETLQQNFVRPAIDKKRKLVYIYPNVAFPDCVMVALQILVLIVGVRILLGEQRAVSAMVAPLFNLVPSSIG